jgi:hypothetical protein
MQREVAGVLQLQQRPVSRAGQRRHWLVTLICLLSALKCSYWPGNPNPTTLFPQTMQVDYVRV